MASQAHSIDSVDHQGQGQVHPLLDQAHAPAQDQPAGQDQFPVLLPQGQGRPLLVVESLYGDENFSLHLDNEAALREKQARSDSLDKVAEFCKLDRQDSDAKREGMGMRLPVYNAPTKKLIELSLPWHSSTVPIADRNHNIVLSRLNKYIYMKDQHPAKPWGPKEFFTGSGYYTHNTEGYIPKPESLVISSRPPPA